MQQLVIGICAIILAWWGVGAYLNHRQSRKVLAWLQEGLADLGKLGPVNWIAAFGSIGQLKIAEAVAPFQNILVTFYLEPRTNLPLWLWRRWRGRGDEMVLEANLALVPSTEFELAFQGSRAYQNYLATQEEYPFRVLADIGTYKAACRGVDDPAALARLEAFLQTTHQAVLRLSLQRKEVHLLMRIRWARLAGMSGKEFFLALREWMSS